MSIVENAPACFNKDVLKTVLEVDPEAIGWAKNEHGAWVNHRGEFATPEQAADFDYGDSWADEDDD